MKNYLRKKRTNTFFLLCVILLFFGQYYLYQENKQLLQANNWLSHTDVVIEEVDNLIIDIFFFIYCRLPLKLSYYANILVTPSTFIPFLLTIYDTTPTVSTTS